MSPHSLYGKLAEIYLPIALVLTGLVHILFAFGIYRDAILSIHSKKGLFAVGPFTWALATLVGGIFVVALYWAIHHSILRNNTSSDSR